MESKSYHRHAYLRCLRGQVLRKYLVQSQCLLHQDSHVHIWASGRLRVLPIDALRWKCGESNSVARGKCWAICITHMEILAMKRQSVSHDSNQLRMNLILMLVVVLRPHEVDTRLTSPTRTGPRKIMPLTRLSLLNSINMTACFGFKCRRKVSRTYGMRAIMTDRDCDQVLVIDNIRMRWPRAARRIPRCLAVIFLRPVDRMAPAPRTTRHARELKALRYSIIRNIASVVNNDRLTMTFK